MRMEVIVVEVIVVELLVNDYLCCRGLISIASAVSSTVFSSATVSSLSSWMNSATVIFPPSEEGRFATMVQHGTDMVRYNMMLLVNTLLYY